MSRIWDLNFQKLCDYKALYGDTNVPKSYHDTKLARLVISLRQQKRNQSLKPERELALHQIGFDFEPHETTWQANYQSVVEFYRLNGHASPNRRSLNEHERTLAEWVHRMHKLVRDSALDDDKITKLKMINIDGNPANHHINKQGLTKMFAEMLRQLQQTIDQSGTEISASLADSELYEWLLLQHKRIQASVILPKEYTHLLRTDFSLKIEQHNTVVSFDRKSA